MTGVFLFNMDNWSVFNGQKRLFYRKKKLIYAFIYQKAPIKCYFLHEIITFSPTFFPFVPVLHQICPLNKNHWIHIIIVLSYGNFLP